jgi:outer membrane receptor protein involved in Fe transport
MAVSIRMVARIERCGLSLCAFLFLAAMLRAQSRSFLCGIVLDEKRQAVAGAMVTASSGGQEIKTSSGAEGRFTLQLPPGPVTLHISGKFIADERLEVGPAALSTNLEIHIHYKIAPVHENLVITSTALDPTIDRRNDSIYKNTLFSRDDQIFDTLAAGINAGQHEGGGKSLEIRRFGFNLDHGGVNGGLKVLVDDVPQNQATQAHGQGYLGGLKSLTPELVDDVDILNGPFSAEYGDFSGLGVVHVRLKETLPDPFTARIQGGSFGGFRTFLAYSPHLQHSNSFIAYEGTRTEGFFIHPLRYHRHNLTGNYVWQISEKQSLGCKLNFGTNDFFSSGQIPLDLVAARQLNRFGFVDPFDGGRVRLGTFGTYYRKEFSSGDIVKVDGFLSRSLFDLYSNFTFFLRDPVHGDEIQQHDSRLQEGLNSQYLHPWKLFSHAMLLTLGGNFDDNQINVGLLHTEVRKVLDVSTSAHAHVTNMAGYVQQGADFLKGRLHFDAGLRYDYFRFHIDNHIVPAEGGAEGAARLQPKANISFTPSAQIPLTLFASYGRGISSQDARGVVERRESPRLSTTDFYELGSAHNLRRISLSTDVFLINRSNEQVYIPDDGSFEFKGPSRAYGWEAKTAMELTHRISFNGGFTQVSNAYYRYTFPRVYVDSAPHSVANAGLTLTAWHGLNGSLRYRHISAYRLQGLNPPIRATGLDVLDLSVSKQLRPGVDFNFSVDNLNDKRYWETQNYFESQVTPLASPQFRIHGTPGFPIGLTAGLTFHLRQK